jgi:predicted Holliday junction resolvase-like endonuclease
MAEPIDFISFDGLFANDKVERITFIEAKTGKARMSPRQRSIEKAVKEGEVYFEEFRIPT